MTEADTTATATEEPQGTSPQTIEKGTYEIIRDRLRGHAKTLRGQADALTGPSARLSLEGG